ncbi:MAG: hypothetical protein WD991_00255 [Candidatus Paceibacterota bacterium]
MSTGNPNFDEQNPGSGKPEKVGLEVDYRKIFDHERSRMDRKYPNCNFVPGSLEVVEIHDRATKRAVQEVLENMIWDGEIKILSWGNIGEARDNNKDEGRREEIIETLAFGYTNALVHNGGLTITLSKMFPELSETEAQQLAIDFKKILDRVSELIPSAHWEGRIEIKTQGDKLSFSAIK